MILASLRNPYLVIVMALAIVVLGVFAYTKVPADLLPQFETSAVQIVCFYPGMPPEVMEKDIMSRLQRWTGQSVGIEHQEAKAMQSVCVVKDFFREGVSMEEAMSQVTSYAMSDMFYLPPGTIPPMVMPFDPTASVPLCLVVVSNPEMTEGELYDIAYYELRNKLQSIQGVIAPAVYGGKLRRILAYVDPEKLEAQQVSPMDVHQALLSQNVLIPGGSIKDGKVEYQIFTNANVEKVEELNDLPIKRVGDHFVYMRDVADVQSAAQIQTNIVRVNGSRKAYIPIYRQPGANTISIVKQIKKQLSTIQERLKVEATGDDKEKMQSLVLSVAMDQSIGVEQSNRSLQIAAGLGALLAGLVVLLFLRSFRFTLVIVLAMPIAILFAILCMYFMGQTLNAMTLGGLALAIGILIDQSIVVLENVIRHARMGKHPLQASYDGTREVAVPMLVATITFAIVFVPVLFMTGTAQFLFKPLAYAAGLAIIASYIIAITLIPAYCSRFLPQQQTTNDSGAGDSNRFGDWYASFLSKILAFRIPVTLVALALFALAVWVMNYQMGRELFPPVDSGQMTILVRMKSGTRIEETEKTIIEVEKKIKELCGEPDPAFAVGKEERPESNLTLLVSNIGVLLDWPAAYTPNSGSMDAFMLVQTKSKAGKENIFKYVEKLREILNRDFPDVEFAFDTGGMLTAALNQGEPSPIHFQVQSKDLDAAQDIGKLIVEAAEDVEGTADVRIQQRVDNPILMVDIDREKALDLGLTADEVMKNLVSVTNSSINFDPAFWIDKYKGNHYFLGVQYPEDLLTGVNALEDIVIRGGPDGVVRMKDVVKFDTTQKGPAVVNHRNIARVTDLYVNVKPGFDVGTVVQKIEQKLESLGAKSEVDERGRWFRLGTVEAKDQADVATAKPLADAGKYKGRAVRMMGEVKTMRESFRQFISGAMIAALLVYLAMVGLFRSFVDPLIVILAVPLGFIGVVAVLLITGNNLSIMAMMGVIMMIGIVVEYSIVLVDFANKKLAEGISPREAIIEAARVRLRPILMTSLTTWLAMLPMAIGFGGGDANVPLARAIIGGVIGATLLSLVVVPCLYVLIKRRPSTEPEYQIQI